MKHLLVISTSLHTINQIAEKNDQLGPIIAKILISQQNKIVNSLCTIQKRQTTSGSENIDSKGIKNSKKIVRFLYIALE